MEDVSDVVINDLDRFERSSRAVRQFLGIDSLWEAYPESSFVDSEKGLVGDVIGSL